MNGTGLKASHSINLILFGVVLFIYLLRGGMLLFYL